MKINFNPLFIWFYFCIFIKSLYKTNIMEIIIAFIVPTVLIGILLVAYLSYKER